MGLTLREKEIAERAGNIGSLTGRLDEFDVLLRLIKEFRKQPQYAVSKPALACLREIEKAARFRMKQCVATKATF